MPFILIFQNFPMSRLLLTPRPYQQQIAQSALAHGNTLVVLPTGLGKTAIALLLIDAKMDAGRCIFLAPTRPLCEQHYKTVLSSMGVRPDDVALITGTIAPAQRAALWNAKICISTPQTAKNDMMAHRLSPKFSLCIIDEAHRSVGNYAYTFVAKHAAEEGALLLGLTASPGGNRKRISEIMQALSITNVQIRDATDADIVQYVQPSDVEWVRVELPAHMQWAQKTLSEMVSQEAEALRKMGFVSRFISKKHLLEMRKRILASNSNLRFPAISHYASLFNLVHMSELFETQGVSTFLAYVDKMRTREQSKALMRILSDPRFLKLEFNVRQMAEHPKLAKLVQLLSGKSGQKSIVFVQYRNQVAVIEKELSKHGISARMFVGKKEGFSQQQQKDTIAEFREGKFDVLIATSIGEEGLDIPVVDSVIFFEPIPSEIRTIQRRGRAGRAKAGKVTILIAAGTRDEAFYYASRKREGNMKRIMGAMQSANQRPSNEKEIKNDRKLPLPAVKKPPESKKPTELAEKKPASSRKKEQSRISDYF